VIPRDRTAFLINCLSGDGSGPAAADAHR
jgi:hypothetical protein